jgi:hypothetical protein
MEYAMTNSFGFGRTNASLIFRKATPQADAQHPPLESAEAAT